MHHQPTTPPRRSQTLSLAPALAWRRSPIGAGAAVAAIGAYQRYVSPHKGYRCAWGVHTGKSTCSTWGRRVMGRFGVVVGWALLLRQFRRCQCAAAALHAQAESAQSAGAPKPGPSDKPSDPVVNEACPLWSVDGARWLWRRGGDGAGAFCCASWLLSP